MSIGAGIVLFVIGAILAFALNVQVDWVNLDLVGYILMGAGVVVALIGIVMLARRRRSETVTRTAVDPVANERVTRSATSTTDDAAGSLTAVLAKAGTALLEGSAVRPSRDAHGGGDAFGSQFDGRRARENATAESRQWGGISRGAECIDRGVPSRSRCREPRTVSLRPRARQPPPSGMRASCRHNVDSDPVACSSDSRTPGARITPGDRASRAAAAPDGGAGSA